MERAIKVANSRDPPSGTTPMPKLSFCHLSDSVVVARASKLGVLLGKSPTEIAFSVKNLKNVKRIELSFC